MNNQKQIGAIEFANGLYIQFNEGMSKAQDAATKLRELVIQLNDQAVQAQNQQKNGELTELNAHTNRQK